MANRIRALRDALLSKRPDNSLLCFSAFGRAAVIIFPNHWPRKACAQQNWSERVSISQIDRRGGVARQSERWMKRTERPSMEDRAAGHLHIRQVQFRLCAGPPLDPALVSAGGSEERRVGKECVSPCSSRGSPSTKKK